MTPISGFTIVRNALKLTRNDPLPQLHERERR